MELVKICRVCLLPEDKVRLLDWYRPIDSLDYDLSYKECFCKCTQINLNLKEDPNEKEDVRTQFLCITCAEKLINAYEFIEKAKKADIELRGMEVDRIFEWVSVNVKDVEEDAKMVDNKSNLDEVKSTNEWHVPSIDEKGIEISDKIVRDDIISENFKKEFNDPEENASVTSDNLLVELDAHFMDDDVQVFSNENSSNKDIPRKKLQKKNTKRKSSTQTTNNNLKRVKKRGDEPVACEIKNAKRKSTTQTTNNNLKREKKRGDDRVPCEICSKVLKRTTLKKHKQRHKPKAFLCQSCPKTFNDSNALKTHELIHDEKRERLPCDKCHQTFSSTYTLKAHMMTHDNNRKPIHKCAICQKSFLHKNGLLTHELHHKGAKFECNICQKRYVQKSDLDSHLKTHSGVLSHVCNICGRSFIHKKVLNKHLQHHDGFFRYTCTTCGEAFSKYEKYYKHRMKHTGLPFKCGVCEKEFPDSYKMKRHITGVHKIYQDDEVKKLMVKVIDTKEYRGRIVEVLRDPEEIVNQNNG